MNVIELYKGDILYYEFNIFRDINFIKHIFTSRIGWNTENSLNNLSKIFSVPKTNIVNLKQVHGTHIKIINERKKDYSEFIGSEGDGLITNIPNIVLATYHADCVPIYFLDIEEKVIGLAHGGWRGSFGNISGKMVQTMVEEFDSKPENLLVAIGPSIGPCCYEVSKDLGYRFVKRYCNFNNVLRKEDNKTYLNLWRINYLQIRAEGVIDENIILSNICTSCNLDRFYSYRGEQGTNNRMIAAISLDKV